MKGLIVCAGKGTRLKPFTFSRPKTLLPVANKPILFYAIEKLADKGIRDIGIVIHPSQEPLICSLAGKGECFGVSLTYIYQNEPKGIADAVAAAESFIGKNDFILMLGDNLVKEPLDMLIDQLKHSTACLLLTKVNNPQQYGVAEINDNEIIRLEEKPEFPKSNLTVVGVYAFKNEIFNCIRVLTASKRGELEITDAIQRLIDQKDKVAYVITSQHCSDVGNPERWLEANKWMMDEVCNDTNIISADAILINCTINSPVIISSGCMLKNCTIGPYVSVMSGATLEECHMEHSVLLQDVTISGTRQNYVSGIFGEKTRLTTFGDSHKEPFILGDLSQCIWPKH
ncbi:glucose-1-phosphate thymidylyltransferase [Paenibacillus donghaensis]|uniref:Glucose-1-phosphate thymidylyltransferase n=1 Tax=Paenibacillus donghaensis TaxID=414771 RepID=A0A2Z2KD08_9BACL|nr:glucose-1-phosphate thymidylyltransferase [Paenibacillus donghaensis]ASA19859.1 glucose-1-phosphate thymidylyltransferase [Paenibacillus donghaensis]